MGPATRAATGHTAAPRAGSAFTRHRVRARCERRSGRCHSKRRSCQQHGCRGERAAVDASRNSRGRPTCCHAGGLARRCGRRSSHGRHEKRANRHSKRGLSGPRWRFGRAGVAARTGGSSHAERSRCDLYPGNGRGCQHGCPPDPELRLPPKQDHGPCRAQPPRRSSQCRLCKAGCDSGRAAAAAAGSPCRCQRPPGRSTAAVAIAAAGWSGLAAASRGAATSQRAEGQRHDCAVN